MKNNEPLSVFHIDNFGDVTGFLPPNGTNFFVVDDKLYLILWKINENYSLDLHRADSAIVSTTLGDNTWVTKHLKGKAHYSPIDNKLLSIDGNTDRHSDWKLCLFSIDAILENEISVPYIKQKREMIQYFPVPIVDKNGSIILYAEYLYDTRNIVASRILDIFSGGHGSKPAMGSYIQVLTNLQEKSPDFLEPLKYCKVSDASNRSQVVPDYKVNEYLLHNSVKIIEKDTENKDVEVIKYELSDDQTNYYIKDNYTLKVNTHNIEIFNNGKATVPLPKFPGNWNGVEDHLVSYHQHSDLCMDNRGNIYYAFYSERMDEGDDQFFYLFSYDQSIQKWASHKVACEGLIYNIDVYKWKDFVYIAVRKSNSTDIIRFELN